MIEPFEPGQVKEVDGKRIVSYGTSSYGYDIRCSNEFKIFTNINSTIVDPKKFDDKSFVDFKGDVCIIPPNSFALARTVEYFRIPRNVLTICLGKSTYARCGIIVNVTPLEPEWEGYVTLEFSNTTPLPAKIYANEGVAQVIFFESDEVCETSYRDRGGKYQGQKASRCPRSSGPAESLPIVPQRCPISPNSSMASQPPRGVASLCPHKLARENSCQTLDCGTRPYNSLKFSTLSRCRWHAKEVIMTGNRELRALPSSLTNVHIPLTLSVTPGELDARSASRSRSCARQPSSSPSIPTPKSASTSPWSSKPPSTPTTGPSCWSTRRSCAPRRGASARPCRACGRTTRSRRTPTGACSRC